MNRTPIFRFSLTMLVGAFLIVLFASYGNKKVHPSINELIVQKFQNKNTFGTSKACLPEFKKYFFHFDIPRECKGTAVTQSGFFHASDVNQINTEYLDKIHTSGYSNIIDQAVMSGTDEEGPAEMSVTEWIAHGGYSADVPEVPASLRHFYDPTTTPGLRHLLDITNNKLMGLVQLLLTNPEIDGVDWALGKPGDLTFGVQEHTYTWEKGKVWMKMALQEKNEDKRSEFMGKAWRSLGETLHMIADNGCPPHVRNDAHPSPLWGLNKLLGNPDPYEEYVEYIRKTEYEKLDETKSGNPSCGQFIIGIGAPDSELKSEFATMKTAREIAHRLAVYTNLNFVTNETISGKDKNKEQVEQVINSTDPYPSPLLDNMTYNEKDFTYSSPSGMKQCVDNYYFMDLIPRMCEPHVDLECVISQAKVLIPNVIEAGVNVMQLFIPKLKVELMLSGKDTIKGTIKHTTDPEYTSEIRYNGKVVIFVSDKNHKKKDEVEVKAKDGVFEATGIKLEKGYFVYARIEFGGMAVESDEVQYKGVATPEVIKYQQVQEDKPQDVNRNEAAGSQMVEFSCEGQYKFESSDGGNFKLRTLYGASYYQDGSGANCDQPLEWSDHAFSATFICNNDKNLRDYVIKTEYSVTIAGDLTADNKCNIKYTFHEIRITTDATTPTKSSALGKSTGDYSFSIKNVPFEEVREIGDGYVFQYGARGSQIKDMIQEIKKETSTNPKYYPRLAGISKLTDFSFDDNSRIEISFKKKNSNGK